MKTYLVLLFLTVSLLPFARAQQIIRLYPGKAPGSENVSWKEQDLGGYLKDIIDPTLTAFVPATPNGTAVIIAPGGGFHFLVYDLEGTAVAKKLAQKGITAFVLKYRLVHEDPAHPYFGQVMNSRNFRYLDSVIAPTVKLALQDGLTAVRYVRQHAADYKINPDRIGFMGSSAGGTLAMSVAYNSVADNRPNFVAPIYAYGNAVIGNKIPSAKTPLFVAVASDDELGLAPYSVQLYTTWTAAKQPVELHLYERGGHGFLMKKQNLPADTWLDRFIDWRGTQYAANP